MVVVVVNGDGGRSLSSSLPPSAPLSLPSLPPICCGEWEVPSATGDSGHLASPAACPAATTTTTGHLTATPLLKDIIIVWLRLLVSRIIALIVSGLFLFIHKSNLNVSLIIFFPFVDNSFYFLFVVLLFICYLFHFHSFLFYFTLRLSFLLIIQYLSFKPPRHTPYLILSLFPILPPLPYLPLHHQCIFPLVSYFFSLLLLLLSWA